MRADISPDLSWVGVLEHHARRTPGKPIATFEGRTVSYGEMAAWSADVAAGLAERGVGRGDVVGLLSYNNVEFLATIFAANHLGAIAMPINWRLAAEEVRFILDHSQARALVCDDALVALADDAIGRLEGRGILRSAPATRRTTAGSASSTSPMQDGRPAPSRGRPRLPTTPTG